MYANAVGSCALLTLQDITRWIILAILYGIVLIMLLILPVTRYPLTTALFVSITLYLISSMTDTQIIIVHLNRTMIYSDKCISKFYSSIVFPRYYNNDGSNNGDMGLWSPDIFQYKATITGKHCTVNSTTTNSVTDL